MKMKKIILSTAVALFLFSAMSLSALADDVSVDVTIDSYLSYNISYSAIAYGSQVAGTSDIVSPAQGSGAYNISINTNGEFDVLSNGTAFTSGSYSFGINNLKMDTDPVLVNLAVGNAVAIGTSPTTIDSAVNYTVTQLFNGFWLTIPSSQPAGSYTTDITIILQNV
jgi:hypothetical protein